MNPNVTSKNWTTQHTLLHATSPSRSHFLLLRPFPTPLSRLDLLRPAADRGASTNHHTLRPLYSALHKPYFFHAPLSCPNPNVHRYIMIPFSPLLPLSLLSTTICYTTLTTSRCALQTHNDTSERLEVFALAVFGDEERLHGVSILFFLNRDKRYPILVSALRLQSRINRFFVYIIQIQRTR